MVTERLTDFLDSEPILSVSVNLTVTVTETVQKQDSISVGWVPPACQRAVVTRGSFSGTTLKILVLFPS